MGMFDGEKKRLDEIVAKGHDITKYLVESPDYIEGGEDFCMSVLCEKCFDCYCIFCSDPIEACSGSK